MTVRVGLGVGVDEVRAVMVHRGAVMWHGAVGRGNDLDRVVSDLLGRAPLAPRRRLAVVAAIGPSLSQVRQLRGVPPVSDLRLLDAAARENAHRYFVGAPSTLVTSSVWCAATRDVWCAAFDAQTIRAVETACSRLGHELVGAAPAGILVARLATNGVAQWQDGPVVADVAAPGGLPESARRCRHDGSSTALTVAPLESMGEDGWRFADAYAAATCAARAPLFWCPTSARPRLNERVKRASLTAMVVLAGLGVVLAPGLRAHAVARSVGAPAPAAHQTAQLNAELRAVTDEINRIARFAATRRPASRLLSGLAEVLPESTAIVSLRVDSATGTIVTLSRRAADIVPQLREVRSVSSGAIVGAVTREVIAGTTLERATLKLRFAGVDR